MPRPRYRDILGPDNFFLEMQYQGIDEQRVVNVGLQPIARDLGPAARRAPTTSTTCRTPTSSRTTSCCASAPARRVNDTERLRYHGDQFYLKTAEEMATVFQDYPGGAREHGAHRRALPRRPLVNGQNYLPNFDVPAGFTLDEYFEHVVARRLRAAPAAAAGARGARRPRAHDRRVRATAELRSRDDQADEVPGYFLIVWDFIRYAREQGIPVGPGRGSAAGSFVAYCLRITDVDPIDYDLIFERFLNPERVSLPDIDIDFCERRRGEVIDYVTRKYGRENVAQIITFGTMKARAVVRDVARVMDMPYADADKVAKAIPPALDMTLAKALEESPTLKEMVQKDERVKELHRGRPAARGHDAACVGARGGSRDRAEAAHRVRAALQESEGRNRHAVGDEGGRARRPPEDGLPRAQHAHADSRCARRNQAHRRHRPRHRRHPARRRRRPTSCSATGRRTASSSSRARACASCCARRSPSASTT